MDVAGRVREKSASAEDRQSQELVSFLGVPASYPHGSREVRSIQTHISWVFVTTPFVFKVKKAVDLGFLDFSTLEKRRHFCQRELELNRRLCPSVYLDIVPIYKSASGFSFKAEGEIAEYSVKMRELPGGWFLSELLVKRLVGENEINRVISCLRQTGKAEDQHRREFRAGGAVRGEDDIAGCLRNDSPFHKPVLRRERKTIS